MKCPRCNENELKESGNALSRKDNNTIICDDCGMDEALEDYVASLKEDKNDN